MGYPYPCFCLCGFWGPIGAGTVGKPRLGVEGFEAGGGGGVTEV